MTNTNTSTLLSPRDEARLSLSWYARVLSDGAADLVAVQPDAVPGALLHQALALRESLDTVIQCAAVAERERGTTWEQIAQSAGMTRQSAHEKWSSTVHSWSVKGRSALPRQSGLPTHQLVDVLDAWHAQRAPDSSRAVSSGLDAVCSPYTTDFDHAHRGSATALHSDRGEERKRLKVLMEETKELQQQGAEATARRRNHRALAACADTLADIYGQLADVEPALATEHLDHVSRSRKYAAEQREMAAALTSGGV